MRFSQTYRKDEVDMLNDIKLLIAENDATNAQLLNIYLSAFGFKNIFAAFTADEAIKIVERNRPDIAFLDVNFSSGINGIIAASVIYQIDPDANIVFVSPYTRNEIISMNEEMVKAHFLVKPYFQNDLRELTDLIVNRIREQSIIKDIRNKKKLDKKVN